MSNGQHRGEGEGSRGTPPRPPGRWGRTSALIGALVLGLASLVLVVTSATTTSGRAAAQGGTKQISAKALTDHECNDTEWHFVITQIDTAADAPATIHVTWANGQSEDVPLLKFTGGTAHYTTTSNLDSTVTSATAVIYADWSGQFNLSHGPCGTPSTSPPTVESSSVQPPRGPPVMSTSAPAVSSVQPPRGPPLISSSAAGAAALTTSAFVPGPGQTGDAPPSGGLPLRGMLLGSGAALLAIAATLFVRVLRRRGNHA